VGAIELTGIWRATAAPAEVWDVVVDLSSWPRWWPAIEGAERTAGSEAEPEAALLVFGTPAPLRPLRIELVVRDLEPGRLLRVEAVDSPIVGDGTLVVTEDDDGTATSFDLALEVRSRLFRPVERLLANAARGSGRDRLRQAGDDLAELAGGEPGRHDV
jgi:uncharacterized protein YndB with AHSA1/START domain